MKSFKIIFSLTVVLITVFSCNKTTKSQTKPENFEPNVAFAELEKDFMKWWTYQSNTISLSSDFEGFDVEFNKIDKKLFLEKLTTGNFIPLRLSPLNGIEQYKLFKLGVHADERIGTTIKNTSLTTLQYYKLEGIRFPEFDFTDLNGTNYTSESIKGKTTVFKTWFINCKACIAEFPELNAFVESHKDFNFVSLALDSEAELNKFLASKTFKYETVANQKQLIQGTLGLQTYPTHIVVDENGFILKVVNNATEMISFLELSHKSIETAPPPPAPM